jgi:Fic family protein
VVGSKRLYITGTELARAKTERPRMDEADFTPNMTGRLVQVTGISGSGIAFVPDSLPPKWEWPARLWPLLAEAKSCLARVDGVGKHLPDPQIVLRPLQNREAQKSSSLEGTITEPEQQVLFQIEPQQPQSAADPANAYKEVYNYAQTLRSRLQEWADLPLSLRLIRHFHRGLAQGVPRFEGEPGEFRRTQNQIGRPPRYVPPPPELIPECLDAFEKYLHSTKGYDPLVEAFITHYQFEAIHPFRDGNGRVGRLLLAVTIMEWCGLSNQWLYMRRVFRQE